MILKNYTIIVLSYYRTKDQGPRAKDRGPRPRTKTKDQYGPSPGLNEHPIRAVKLSLSQPASKFHVLLI